MNVLPIATRESPLALAQARMVQRLLAEAHGVADRDAAFPIVGLTTTGDRLTDRKLIDAGGKGLFTKEIDEALYENRAAIAVHSMKDVPTRMPDGLVLAAFLEREDPRDVLLTATGSSRCTSSHAPATGTPSTAPASGSGSSTTPTPACTR